MHKTKNNKFFRLWRYKIKIQLYNVCIFDFDGRPIECRKSDEGCFGCRIFDIRLCGRSNRKNPFRQIRRIESNFRHSIRQNAHVYAGPVVPSYGLSTSSIVLIAPDTYFLAKSRCFVTFCL